MLRIVITFVAALALAVTGGLQEAAAKGPEVRVAGTCSKGSTAKLKLGAEDGGIEVEFEVDQNRNGVQWRVVLRRNGAVVAKRTAVTRGPSGSFTVRRVVAGGSGTRVSASATSPSGEVCSARATL